MTNKQFANNDQNFIDACTNAGVKPTARQASKFRAGRGRAYNEKKKV